MIIIFGLRRLRKGMGPIMLRCANCGMSPLALFRASTWFALFFIPLIPVSFKHYVACPNCKRIDQVSKADVDHALARAASVQAGEGPVDVSPQPATLEHAVHQWAAVGQSQAGRPEATPAVAPSAPPIDAAPPPAAPAGWYADPSGGGSQRYWDGQRWTEHTTPTA